MDLGTNSFKLLVAEDTPGGMMVLLDRQEVVRLGDRLALTGDFSEEAMGRAVEEVGKMLSIAESLGADVVLAVGTMGFRKASNGDRLIRDLQERFSLDVRIVSGQEEAELSFEASALEGPRVVADIGGGSTELIFGSSKAMGAVSVEVGALFLTDRFLDPRSVPSRHALDEAHHEAREVLLKGLSQLELPSRQVPLCGVGGTFTTLASVALGLDRYEEERVHGLLLSCDELKRQEELYASMDGKARRGIRGMHPKRADIALGGLVIALEVVGLLGASGVTVSANGLRHALMARLLRGDC